MSQNKFMHPRNIYKKPPSFKEMAIEYPEFRKFAKPDISGKVTLDFQNPDALKALTTTLLKKDFGLDVDIPSTRLIPTLPLRLNYILWIEDLLEAAGIVRANYSKVKGIDIGTGASCIYPLLAAKQNGWQMIGTEIDSESLKIAEKNINANNLQDVITVKLVKEGVLFKEAISESEIYTFSMCNPPFFSSELELDFIAKSRSPNRTPPSNGSTGVVRELVVPGGEVAFVSRMIQESKELGNNIWIYTTMIGHKASLDDLKLQLQKSNVSSMAETRFCQGNTTRWGLAWTYHTNFSIKKVNQMPNQRRNNLPMTYIVPRKAGQNEESYSVEVITEMITVLLSKLEVKYKVRKKTNFMTVLEIIAYKNTWSHQRRKKRLTVVRNESDSIQNTAKSETTPKEEKLWLDEDNTCLSKNLEHEDAEPEEISSVMTTGSIYTPCAENLTDRTDKKVNSLMNSDVKDSNEGNHGLCFESNTDKKKIEEKDISMVEMCAQTFGETTLAQKRKLSKLEQEKEEVISKKIVRSNEPILPKSKSEDGNMKHQTTVLEAKHSNKEDDRLGKKALLINHDNPKKESLPVPLVEATVLVRNVDSEIHVEFLWKSGTGGRESMHQVLQYIKNTIK